VFTLLAIYIYGEEPETSKYAPSARTYISPKDYPSTHYVPVGAIQRSGGCEPAYVSYAEAMEWCKSGNSSSRPSFADTTDGSGACLLYGNQSTGRASGDWNSGTDYRDSFHSDGHHVIDIENQSTGTTFFKGTSIDCEPKDKFQTGCTRMRHCDMSGNGNGQSETAYNWERSNYHGNEHTWPKTQPQDGYATVSPV